MADLNTLAAALIAARDVKAEAEATLKEANKEVEAAQNALFAQMVESELSSINANGYRFTIDTKEYYSVPGDNLDTFHDVMDSLGRGAIFKFTVHHQTLQATLRELAGQHGGELPEDVAALVNVFDKPGVMVRKVKGA